MIQFYNSTISKCIIHFVGNKSLDEHIKFSKTIFTLSEEINYVLTNYFFRSFLKKEDFFNLYHDVDLNLNEIYSYVSQIFEDSERFHEQSVNLAKHLYEQSTHPKIKGGEFYVVYFKNCLFEGKTIDAIGLFKSENKDTFLKVYPKGDGFEIESEKGVNINLLDKGCLILNTEKDNGYLVSVVDNTNKGTDAKYWTDHFIHLRPREDEYFNTQRALSLCKSFVISELPKKMEVSKADQADLLNRSVSFFKEKETFNIDEFTKEVIGQPLLIDSFNKYKTEFQCERGLTSVDNFQISNSAVKKQERVFKSIIKLDKNFDIYIHGKRELIEQGIDDKGRRYYKFYYTVES